MKKAILFILIIFSFNNTYATSSIIQFEQEQLEVFEKYLQINILISRSLSDSATTSVMLNLVSQTANSNTDYIDTSAVITWTDGDSTDKAISIRIIEDFMLEGDEIFFVILSGISGNGSLGTKDTLQITIHDSYADIASSTNTDAIHKDSPLFKFWATGGIINRGYINIADTTATDMGDNRASFGALDSVFDKAAGNTISIASLGDAGYAILTFDTLVTNGIGPDFAVFENSFDETFLEYAFVEVSSDGINFYRFPAISNTPDNIQVGSFGSTDAKDIHNLAGKYKQSYGTPFDLEDLKDSIGLDINRVTHIKIIDVIGTIDSTYASYDSKGNIVNDPFATPFASGGFDLEAVGIINALNATGISNLPKDALFKIYPNPFVNRLTIELANIEQTNITFSLINIFGQKLEQWHYDNLQSNTSINLNIENYPAGIYFVKSNMKGAQQVFRLLKKD